MLANHGVGLDSFRAKGAFFRDFRRFGFRTEDNRQADECSDCRSYAKVALTLLEFGKHGFPVAKLIGVPALLDCAAKHLGVLPAHGIWLVGVITGDDSKRESQQKQHPTQFSCVHVLDVTISAPSIGAWPFIAQAAKVPLWNRTFVKASGPGSKNCERLLAFLKKHSQTGPDSRGPT